MNFWNGRPLFKILMIAAGIGVIGGCDSGEKVVDEVTGRRAVRQYHKSKEDLEKIEEQQAERYRAMLDDVKKEDEEQ